MTQVGKQQVSSFKDFEKKTLDVWDIDDDISEQNYFFDNHTISIPDSEEMARRIIKNHQESQEKLNTTPDVQSKQQQRSINQANLSKLITFFFFCLNLYLSRFLAKCLIILLRLTN